MLGRVLVEAVASASILSFVESHGGNGTGGLSGCSTTQPHRCKYYEFSIFCGIRVEEMGWQRVSEGGSSDFLRESLKDWPEAELPHPIEDGPLAKIETDGHVDVA